MKSVTRTLTCLLLALCMLLPLTACGGGNWRTDVSAQSLCDSVIASLPVKDGWRAVTDKYISASSWGEDYATHMEKVTEYRIMVSENSDMNIDEVGIFRCASEKDAKAVAEFAQGYLDTKKLQMTPLLESYNPAELPKLDTATVNVIGCYVLYTILNSSETTTAGSAFEKALTPAA
ncbi:MAG: DUF4358 domain-containing protein [Clostridia bacterium]|nr:DUF4358 domain-containing protein [Clostridia bacterium]